jgi:hypothetical protein
MCKVYAARVRGSTGAIAVVLCACGSGAGMAPPERPDAPACEKHLLIGGMAPLANGWSMTMEPPATLTDGLDYVALHTSTVSGQNSGGQLLLRYPGAVDPTMAFAIEIVMLVDEAAAHNPLDASVAIMPSCTGSAGSQSEREQMLYLQSGRIGWADDTDEFSAPVTDGAYHSYLISIDAAGTEQVSVDGQLALTRVNVLRDGAITIGDQSNDRDLDSTIRIRSVTKRCI